MCQRVLICWFRGAYRIIRRSVLYVGRWVWERLEDEDENSDDRMGLMLRPRRPSTAQIFGWCLLLLQLILEVVSTLPLATPYITGIFVIGLLLILVQVFFLTIYDPIPEALEEKRKLGIKPMPFDALRHRHVIENQFCNVCQIPVKNYTKHCRRCNMCVEDFDHHCVWLNNCVGRHNYKRFLFLVASLSFFSLAGCLLSFALVLSFFSRTGLIATDLQSETIHLDRWFFTELDQRLWLAANVACLFVNMVCAILTIHLLIFHFKIIRQGISTYIFISLRRKPAARETGTATGSDESQPQRPPSEMQNGTGMIQTINGSKMQNSPLRVRAVADSNGHQTTAIPWANQCDLESNNDPPIKRSSLLPSLEGRFKNSVHQDLSMDSYGPPPNLNLPV